MVTRIALLVAISLCFINQSFGQQTWKWLNPTLNGNRVHGVSLIDTSRIVISYDNELLISSDNGKLWTNVPLAFTTHKVIKPSLDLSFALTTDGQILKNVLSGTIKSVFQKDALEFKFYDIQLDPLTGIGIAVGGYEEHVPVSGGTAIYYWSVVVKTTDSGENWEVVYEERGDILKKLICLENKFLAYGTEHSNFVLQSEDAGTTWGEIESFGIDTRSISGLAFLNDTTGLLTYYWSSELYITQDAGLTWNLYPQQFEGLRSIVISDSTIIAITYSAIHISSNGGTTWTEKKLTPISVEEVLIKQNRIFVLDQLEGMFISTDSGNTFDPLNENLDRLLGSSALGNNQIQFTSKDIGYAVITDKWADDHILMKTVDGGCSWEEKATVPGFSGARKLKFINDQVGFAAGGAGSSIPSALYRTIDGGTSWQQCNIGNRAYFFVDFAFFTEATAIAFTDEEIYKTVNGGLTWTLVNSLYGTNNNTFTLNETTAFAAYSSDQFFKTTNAGNSWTKTTVGFNLDWRGVHFFDTQNGLMVGDATVFEGNQWVYKKHLIKTTNGGTSWTKVMDLPERPIAIKFINADEGYILGASGMYLKTSDKGLTWNQEDIIAKNDLYDLFDFEGTRYVTGEYTALVKKANPPTATFTLQDNSICQGDTVFTINESQFANTFLWLIDGEEVSTENSPSFKLNSPGMHTIELRSGDCNLTHYELFNDAIEVFPTPEKPALVINDQPAKTLNVLCDSTYIIATNLSYPAYSWSNESVQPEVVISDESSLSLITFSDNGCKAYSDTISFTRLELPIAEFDFTYSEELEQVIFENQSSHSETYLWDLGDGTSSTLDNVNHTFLFPDEITEYVVSLISENYCGSDTIAKIVKRQIILGTDNGTNGIASVYPNPVNALNSVTVTSENFVYYSIQSISGLSIVDKSPILASCIPIPNLSPGVFILTLYDHQNKISSARIHIK